MMHARVAEVMAVEIGSNPTDAQDLYFTMHLTASGKALYKSETVRDSDA